MWIDPEIEKAFGQLQWVERRRQRVIAAVGSHFGMATAQRVLKEAGVDITSSEDPFASLIDERDPPEFLAALADQVLTREARTIAALRKNVSTYPQHVDEQILFGTRTAGQEAARAFMARNHPAADNAEHLELAEAIQALLELSYFGLPGEKNYFLSLRAHGGSTVHFSRSPQLEAWRSAEGDSKFLHQLKEQWVRGILDILSPTVEYSSPQSLEEGHAFGLAQFHLRGVHAGP
jgi:hypothetical protein